MCSAVLTLYLTLTLIWYSEPAYLVFAWPPLQSKSGRQAGKVAAIDRVQQTKNPISGEHPTETGERLTEEQ